MSWYKEAQEGWQKSYKDVLGDVQRYLYDAYECRVYLTKMAKKTTVSITLAHYQLGHVVWQDFWNYKPNETEKATSTFEAINKASKKIFNDFKTNAIPNPMLHSYLREGVRFIDIQHKPTCRIPSVDWAREHSCVTDWRNSIYGNRYPNEEISGF